MHLEVNICKGFNHGHEYNTCGFLSVDPAKASGNREKEHPGKVGKFFGIAQPRKCKVLKLAKAPREFGPNLGLIKIFIAKSKSRKRRNTVDCILDLFDPKSGTFHVCSECEAYFRSSDHAGKHFERAHVEIWRLLKYPAK